MSNVLIVNRSCRDAGRRRRPASYYSNTNVIRIKKKNKNSFTKSSFVTLLLVSQNALYDTKVEKVLLFKLKLRKSGCHIPVSHHLCQVGK
jgi:hypothetical protein